MPPGVTLTTLAILLCCCGAVLVMGGLLTWLNHADPKEVNDHRQAFPSPDGNRVAMLYRRGSPGPQDFTTHVTLIGAREKLPDRPGKVLIAEGEPKIDIRWLDDRHLLVAEAEGTKVILRATEVGGVKIGSR